MKTVLDAQWYEPFKNICSFQAYEYLTGDFTKRNIQKKKFLTGQIENPKLDFPKLNKKDLLARQKAILNLQKDILKNETNKLVKETYTLKIAEKMAEIDLLLASINKDWGAYMKAGIIAFDKPSEKMFKGFITLIKDILDDYAQTTNPSLSEYAHRFRNAYPIFARTSRTTYHRPTLKDRKLAQTYTEAELGPLLYDLPESREKPSHEFIQQVFARALKHINAKGWKAKLDTNSTLFNVNQEERIVRIPIRKEISYRSLRRLLIHEIGTHVKRRIRGENSALMLLGLGLDGYEKGEEGIATMREQITTLPFQEYKGIPNYLASSFALGMDGTPRAFREVFELMDMWYTMRFLSKGHPLSTTRTKAQNGAWKNCLRMFRGTDCKTPGVCFLKDYMYYEGNINVWNCIRKTPQEITRFSVGKYDPSNEEHIHILDKLRIKK